MGMRGLRAISKGLPCLYRLEVGENLICDEEASFLARNFPQLSHLSISKSISIVAACEIKEEGVTSLALNLQRLNSLALSMLPS